MTMMQSGVELTITTFGTLLIAGAEAHDYSLVQEVRPASLAPAQKEKSHGVVVESGQSMAISERNAFSAGM